MSSSGHCTVNTFGVFFIFSKFCTTGHLATLGRELKPSFGHNRYSQEPDNSLLNRTRISIILLGNIFFTVDDNMYRVHFILKDI